MHYSEFPIGKKIKTLLRDLSFYYIRSWYDSIPEEDSDGDIQKSHELINDKFAKAQIDSFFFTINFQPILYPAYALLMYYKYNPKFADYVNSVYMNDEQLIDDLHAYYHGELEKRINEAMLKAENDKTEVAIFEWPIITDNEYLFDNSLLKVAGPKNEENVPVPLPPAFIADQKIEVISAEVWDNSFKIEFIDKSSKENYFIRFYDKEGKIIKKETKKAKNNGEMKTIIIDNCSYKLFTEYVWNISRD